LPEDTFLLCQIQTAIVGGLLPEATTESKGLLSSRQAMPYRDYIPPNTDLNTLGQGIWIKASTSTGVSNIPPEVGSSSFLIHVERIAGGKVGVGTNSYYMQTITTMDGAVFRRIYWADNWRNWVKL